MASAGEADGAGGHSVCRSRGCGPPTYPGVNRAMAEAYRSGLPVLFFPEGTTTNGCEVLPFRRGLFHSVLNNGVQLRTAALLFAIGDGNGKATVADDVCWWGEALFGPHLFRCLGLKGVKARIAFEDGTVGGADRFELSERARERVVRAYEGLSAVKRLHTAVGEAPSEFSVRG